MCDTCGCGETNKVTISKMPQKNEKESGSNHSHTGGHNHGHHHKNIIELEQDVLSANNQLAEANRLFFEKNNVFAYNLVSSPGSGKTTFLERTLKDLKNEISFKVIEGDQQTLNDAERIQALEIPVVQINTGQGCHLDSNMINKAIEKLAPMKDLVLFIENVGNLVCPSLFNLGEKKRIVIVSITEGEDKPLKYPDIFSSSDICIINKIDLLPYVNFDIEKLKEYANRINHHLEFFEVSAITSAGMDDWYMWLKNSSYSLKLQ